MILVLVYAYLYTQVHKRCFALWTFAWLIYFLRFIVVLAIEFGNTAPSLHLLHEILVLASGICLIWGTALFLGKPFSRIWGILFLAGTGWAAFAIFSGLTQKFIALPTFILIGGIYIWTGIVFLRAKDTGIFSRLLTGWSFIVWGLHKIDYPFLRTVPEVAPWGFLLSALLEFLVAIGIIFVYFEKNLSTLNEARNLITQSEARCRALFENAFDATYLADQEGIIVDVNQVACTALGYSREELIGKKLIDVEKGFTPDQISGQVQALFAGESLTFEGLHCRKDGSTYPVEVRAKQVILDNKPFMFGLARDLTAQHQAEAKQTDLQHLLEATLNEIYLFDTRTLVFEYVNKSARDNLGYSLEQLQQMTAVDLKPEFTEGAFRAHVEPLLRGEKQQLIFQTTHQRANMTTYPVEVHLQLVSQGDNRRFLAIIFDISDRKRTEEKFMTALQLNQTLLDAFPFPALLVHYPERLILNANRIAKESGAVIGGFCYDKFAATAYGQTLGKRCTFCRAAEMFQKGQPVIVEDLYNSGKWWNIHWIPVKENLFLTFAVDITDRKKIELDIMLLNANLEERVRKRTRQLEASNRELESFCYSISHDLRTPLRSIDGFSNAMLEDCADQLDENGRHYLVRIRKSTTRMGQLIDDLLTLSRVARSEINKENVDLSDMAREISADLHGNNPQRVIDFRIQNNIVVQADAHLMKAAMDNLLGNAWKYSEKNEQTIIEFGRKELEGRSVLFVKDNGAGFDMEFYNKLFEPFQRLHNQDEFEGTGVGLASVQKIIERHGGTIWAESEIGKGATFYFTIPSA